MMGRGKSKGKKSIKLLFMVKRSNISWRCFFYLFNPQQRFKFSKNQLWVDKDKTFEWKSQFLLFISDFRCASVRTPANNLIVNLAVADFIIMLEAPMFIYNCLNFGPAIGEFGEFQLRLGMKFLLENSLQTRICGCCCCQAPRCRDALIARIRATTTSSCEAGFWRAAVSATS